MLFQRFSRTARQVTERLAVADPKRALRYGELVGLARSLGRLIAQASPAPDDPVGILLPSSAGFAATFWAVQAAGRIALPLNFMLAGAELAGVLGDSGARLVVTTEAMAPLLEPARQALGERMPAVLPVEDLLAAATAQADRPGPEIPARRTAVLLYTSGSTGRPKGVMLSPENLLSNCDGAVELARISPDQGFLGVLPLFHTFGLMALLIIPTVIGSTVHYLPRFAPRLMLEAITRLDISVTMAVPSMCRALTKVAAAEPALANLGRCDLFLCGGEPLPMAIAEDFQRVFGRPVLEGYGLTETSPAVALNLPWACKAGTVGRPLPNVRVELLDESLAPVAVGSAGEIVIAGPTVMLGYHRRPEETAAVLTPAGALRSGDLGRFDAEGFLSVVGRIKDMMIVGGENVFPLEIEQALDTHPKVDRSAVLGLPDGTRGEMIAAYVCPRDPADPPNPAELRAFCKDRLAGYKVPRQFTVLPELPLGPTGKVLRKQLRGR